MSVHTHAEFQTAILKSMGFTEAQKENCTRWENKRRPQDGYFLQYERAGMYTLGVAAYTVPTPFSLEFALTEPVLRFGALTGGRTRFAIEGVRETSSAPAPFLVREERLRGQQFWNTGERYAGVEFTLRPAYLKRLRGLDPQAPAMADFAGNCTYHALPAGLITMLGQVRELALSESLTPLALEGALLGAMGELTTAVAGGNFRQREELPSAWLGARKLRFDAADLLAVQQARRLLAQNLAAPLTIPQLSKQVFLNEQKLKAGFSLCYHTTIGRFRKECRLSHAAELLTGTELLVREIAAAVGYESCATFIRTFRGVYHQTPETYRRFTSARQ